jgi:hypothetical protein
VIDGRLNTTAREQLAGLTHTECLQRFRSIDPSTAQAGELIALLEWNDRNGDYEELDLATLRELMTAAQ